MSITMATTATALSTLTTAEPTKTRKAPFAHPTGAAEYHGKSTNWIIGVVMGVLSIDVLLIVTCIMGRRWWRRRKARRQAALGEVTYADESTDVGMAAVNNDRTEDVNDTPRPPKPAHTKAYTPKVGGKSVADQYMAKQRKEGWVSEGLLPTRKKSKGTEAGPSNES